MSDIRHYRVLPWATGPLTLLESIAKLPDRQVAKTGKSLTSFFVSHASTITVEAITNAKKRHRSLGTVLFIVIIELEPFFSERSSTPMLYLMLYAILLEQHYS